MTMTMTIGMATEKTMRSRSGATALITALVAVAVVVGASPAPVIAQTPESAGTDGAADPVAVEAPEAPPLSWAACTPEQVKVLIFGTFHFHQAAEVDDILQPERQRELAHILDALEDFEPRRIAVERARARSAELDSAYRHFLDTDGAPAAEERNEIVQVGFRLARRLGHERVHAVDVPMNLWDDSIPVFDETHPEARTGLRAHWSEPRYAARSHREVALAPLPEVLWYYNSDRPPANAEMYANFLPLVEDDLYAGAWKLRPWYDRNLRIVQNLFRIAEPGGDRILLVIGAGHLRVLKQILAMTPQMCAVSALPYLERAGREAGG